MHDVFMSHAADDHAVTRRIASHLEASGCRCWFYERDFEVGQTHLETSERAIDECRTVIVLVSDASISSDYVFPEILHAVAKGKRFIPVLLGMEYKDLEARRPRWVAAMGPYAAIQWHNADVETVLNKIATSVGSHAVVKGLKTKLKTTGEGTENRTVLHHTIEVGDALSVEVLFKQDIEEGGAYIGDVEDSVSAKAEARCVEILALSRAVLIRTGRDRRTHSDGPTLTFAGGHISANADRTWGSSFDVRYTVTTRVFLCPVSLQIIDELVAKLGAYRELAYQLSESLQPEEIAESNGHLLDSLHSVDGRRIAYRVEDVFFALDSEPDGSRLSVTHRYRELNKRLHHIVTAELLLSWLTGLEADVGIDGVQFVE